MHSISRRQALAFGMAGAASLALAACAAPGGGLVNSRPVIPAVPGEKITLTYWAWLKDLQKVADVWNAQNPLVQVEAVWIPGGNAGGYQKMYSAIAAGGGPDIGQVELRQLPEFLLANGVVDLSRYGADQYQDRYDAGLWQQVSFNGSVYAIPQDSGPMAFYYQRELFEQIGATPPTTWDEWALLAAEVRQTGRQNYLDVFPVGDASVFTAYATQAGAAWFRPDGDRWIVDMLDPATLEVAAFFDRAIDADIVNTGYAAYSPPWYAAAAAEQVYGVTGASWGDALVQSISGGEGKWGVAPMQTWGDTGFGSTYLGGSTSAVLANSKHPKEALDFITWMTTSPEGIDAMIANSGIGWSPASDYIGAARAEPSAWFSGQNYNEEVFAPAAADQSLDWTWAPLTQFALNTLQDEFRLKVTSGQSLVDSLVKAQEDIIQAFVNKGLRVEGVRR
ncbi:MAG: extracellular solute-binding protein [Burkholderiaceae bacterium]|nr:extracellular solute-binding protein [Microbacteriaceae bacterium]